MKAIHFITILFISLLLAGCTAIITKNPIGTKSVKINAEEWDGVWSTRGNGLAIIKVTDENNGKMTIGFIENKGNVFTVQNLKAAVREYKGSTYINISLESCVPKNEKIPKKEEFLKSTFHWFKFQKQGDSIILLPYNEDFFKKAIKNKEIEIKQLKDNMFLINEPSDVISEYIEKNKSEIFNFENKSVVYIRMIKK